MKGETTEGSVIVKMWCDLVGEWRQAKEHKPVPFVCKDENPTTVCPQKGGLIGHKRCNHRFLDVSGGLRARILFGERVKGARMGCMSWGRCLGFMYIVRRNQNVTRF